MSETDKTEKIETEKTPKKKISSRVNVPSQAATSAPKGAADAQAAAEPSSPSKQSRAAAKAAAPAAATAAAPKSSGTLRIRQVKSGICTPEDHKLTLRALGLRRIRHEVVRPDTPTVRGQVQKVRHLVEIVEGGRAR